MQTIDDMICRAVTWNPQAEAIHDVVSGTRLDYRALDARIDGAAATMLEAGVEPGDIVAIVAANTLATIIASLGAHRAGLVPAFLNPRLKPAEVAELVNEAGAAACLLPKELALPEAISPQTRILAMDKVAAARDAPKAVMPPCEPEAPAFIFYTSGTTGLPKGVVIPHRAAEPRVLFMATQVGHTVGPHNRIAGLMPIFHVIGYFAVLVMALAFGGTYHLFQSFDPRLVLDTVRTEKLTGLFATPTHFQLMLDQLQTDDEIGSLAHTAFAGAAMPAPLLERMRAVMPGRLVHIYGTTEAMNSLFMPDPVDADRFRPGFWGEVRIASGDGRDIVALPDGSEGELIIAAGGGAAFTGYLKRPAATASKLRQGWYRTSDAAVRDPDGTVRVLGRLDDMIISGGENIHPSEVEAALLQHPDVDDVAVFGLPDPVWGSRVAAAVAPEGLKQEALDRFLRESVLADYKRPRFYLPMEEIPRNAVGKVDRARLVAMRSAIQRDEPSKEA